MYARITAIHIQPAKLNDMKAAIPSLSSRLKAVPGMVECKVCWNESGQGQVFALYESQAVADAATDTIKGIWGSLVPLLAAPPSASTASEVFDLLS
jgi:hypothetical protein